MASTISFLAGAWLLVVCILVMWEYRPRRFLGLEPFEMLGLGIFIGFMMSAANTAWWQLLNVMNDQMGWITGDEFQRVGRWLDGVFKGGMALAGMIHLAAKRKVERNARNRT